MLSARSYRGMFSLLLVATALWLTAASEAAQPPADEPATPKPDPFAVPEGTPAELLAFIEGLQGRQPPDPDDQESLQAFGRKINGAINAAAERILAGKPTKEQLTEAAYWKASALLSLQALGDAGAEKQLEAFLDRMEKAGQNSLVREIRGSLLQERLRNAMTAGRDELAKMLGEVKRFVGGASQGGREVRLAAMTAQVLEMAGQPDLAADAYRTFGGIFSAGEDPALAAVGRKMEGAARRITLVGKEMLLKGTFLGGQPIDWAAYRGKVVLVQFWATWCGPCRAEIPNILKNYDLYRDRGFEVIGVNCDDDREQLEDFLKENPLPWKNLFSEDPKAAGMENPMAVYYGIMGIPEMILVDAAGKVVSREVRGPNLQKQLEKLLGPLAEPNKKG